MNSNPKESQNYARPQFPPPLLRTKTHILSVCQNLTLQPLQSRLNCNYPLPRIITHLNISSNRIYKLPKISFKSLVILNVSRCLLNDSCIIDLESLQKLDISHNCFTRIPEIKSLKLQYLNLSHNSITCLGGELLKFQELEEVKCNNNQLSMFNINVLKLPSNRNLDIVKLIDLNRVEDIEQGMYSARYLIERSYPTITPELRRHLLVESIRRQYQVGISIFSEAIPLEEQISYIEYCEMNNFNRSLETLLFLFRINDGYDACRVQSLNPQLFHQDNLLLIKPLIYALEQNIEKRYQKCQEFVIHLVKIGTIIINFQTLMDIVHCGNASIVCLLFKHQKHQLSELQLNNTNPHLIKILLQLDNSQLLLLLFEIPTFNTLLQYYLNSTSVCNLIGPKYKIYKLLLKYQRELLKHQVSKKICLFKEYESMPMTNIYTTTPMYGLGEGEEIGYYQMQDPNPDPAQVIIKMNSIKSKMEESNSKPGKENHMMVSHQIQKIRNSMGSTGKPRKPGLTLNNAFN